MREIKFRAIDLEDENKPMYHTISFEDMAKLTIMQYSGLKDSKGVEIYEGDVVYLAGYGDYEAEFPFLQLYDAGMENDIGAIKGNIYQNPELLDE